MKNLLFIFIVFIFLGCNCNSKDKNDCEVLPVTASLKHVWCKWFLSSELNEKAGIKKMGTLILDFTLSNPNDFPVYIPIHNHKDSMYRSDIETYLKGTKLTTEIDVPSLLYHAGILFVNIKIYDINENNQYKGFEDVRKIIPDLNFIYKKDETDSIYRKMKVGDIRFDTDENLEIIYEDSIILI